MHILISLFFLKTICEQHYQTCFTSSPPYSSKQSMNCNNQKNAHLELLLVIKNNSRIYSKKKNAHPNKKLSNHDMMMG